MVKAMKKVSLFYMVQTEIKILAKTSNQKKIVELYSKNDLLFVIGPAGTGKTYVSVALGVRALKEKKVKKIIITRPVVEAGENLGFYLEIYKIKLILTSNQYMMLWKI